ncbi:MAG: LptF/LptG family permease [Bacteroidetes bacterium]|nr:LptF/LptG family permease [Bacteroidota bacterium]
MRLIDRYIVRQFILSTLVSLAAFIILFVAIDMMEKLDKFIDHQVPWHMVVLYYVNFTPQMISLVMPISLLLASLFTTGKMSQQSEIVALRSAGVSLYRYMLPFLVMGTVISVFFIYFNGWLLPRANAVVSAMQRKYDLPGNTSLGIQSNLHLQEGVGEVVTIGNFLPDVARADRISIYFFDPKNPTRLYRRIDAPQMKWDSTKREWALSNATERTFTADSSQIGLRTLPEDASHIHFTFTPLELKERQLKYEELTNPQLQRRIALAQEAGMDTAHDEVDYYSKYSMAFTSFIVVLFGVPFASQKKRGGLALEFAVAIGIAFAYMAFTKVSQTFGYTGSVDPILTAWLANIIFFVISIVVVGRVQK